ncbi:MAG: hypothetical protein AB1710_02200 [Pseudomonadota bacterium]
MGGLITWMLLGIRRRSAEIMKRACKDRVRPRNWSNWELRKIAPTYQGDVINVSGWKDEDQVGGHYADYFPNALSYTISNFVGEKGYQGASNEISLDIEADLPPHLTGQFQVVFNHTTLEHVYDIRKAVANLCAMSHDTVILVTPFLQQVHYEEGSFGDYWRPTPMCLERMLVEHGFEVVYQSSNDNEWYIVYLFTVATRSPEKYRGKIPFQKIQEWVGVKHFGLADSLPQHNAAVIRNHDIRHAVVWIFADGRGNEF